MAIPELVKFREKYPQYEDMDDASLAKSLATKYPDAYGDLVDKISTSTQDKTVMPTLMAGIVGAQGSSLKEEGVVPALVGGASGATGGMLGMVLQNPKSFFDAGYVGANIAAGEDILSMFTGREAPDKAVYAPKTFGGNVAMAASELAAGGKTGLGLISKADDLYKTPGALERLKSMQLSKKGRDQVSTLIPEIKLAADIKQNKPTGAVVEGFNLIKKTNNPVDVVTKFRVEKESILNDVNRLVQENNKPVDPKFLQGRVQTILQRKIDNATGSEKKALVKALQDEVDWLSKQKTVDTVTVNNRKRYLYQETKNIQNKQKQGQTIISTPERGQVQDAFAQAYKEAVEAAHPDIKKLNQRFAGVETGLEAVSKMAERMIEGGSMLDRIASQIAGRPNMAGVGAAAVRELPAIFKNLGRLTGRIEALSSKSADLLAKSRQLQGERLLAGFMKERKLGLPNDEYFRQLLTVDDALSIAGKPKQLTSPVRTYQPLDIKEPSQISGKIVGGQKQLPEPAKFTMPERDKPQKALRYGLKKKGKK